MPQSPEIWALIISILAIGISIFTWFNSHKIDRARRDDEERDQKSAELKAYLKRNPGELIIENIGRSEARNINILIDQVPINKSPGIDTRGRKKFLIGQNSHISFRVSLTFDIPVPVFIEITWDDDHATGKTYRNSLSY